MWRGGANTRRAGNVTLLKHTILIPSVCCRHEYGIAVSRAGARAQTHIFHCRRRHHGPSGRSQPTGSSRRSARAIAVLLPPMSAHANNGPGDTAPLTAAHSDGGDGGTPTGSHSHISPSRVESTAVTRSPAGSSTIEAWSSPHCEVSGMLSPRTPHSGHATESTFVYTLRRPSCRKHSREHPRCGQAHARLSTPPASRHTTHGAVGALWLTHNKHAHPPPCAPSWCAPRQ